MKNIEINEYVNKLISECNFDIDIEFCIKNNIKFSIDSRDIRNINDTENNWLLNYDILQFVNNL